MKKLKDDFISFRVKTSHDIAELKKAKPSKTQANPTQPASGTRMKSKSEHQESQYEQKQKLQLQQEQHGQRQQQQQEKPHKKQGDTRPKQTNQSQPPVNKHIPLHFVANNGEIMERNAGNDGRQPMVVPGTHEKYSDAVQETIPRKNTVDSDEDRNRKIENIKERRNKRGKNLDCII